MLRLKKLSCIMKKKILKHEEMCHVFVTKYLICVVYYLDLIY